MKLSSPPPIRRPNELATLLVFAIIFTPDEMRAHPDYVWVEGDEGPPSTDEEDSEGDSEDDLDEYVWVEGEKGSPSSKEEISEDCSEEENAASKLRAPSAPRAPRSPGFRPDPRMFGVMISLKYSAQDIWKKSRMGRVYLPKTGGSAALSVILADNSNSDAIKMPPPETIERLKEALRTTRDPEWYQAKDL